MFKINFILVCEYALIDTTGKPSFIGVFDEIAPKTKAPYLHPQITMVANFEVLDKCTYKARFRLIRVRDGAEVGKIAEFEPQAVNEPGIFGVIGDVKQLLFEESGEYKVQFFLTTKDEIADADLIKELSFKVKLAN